MYWCWLGRGIDILRLLCVILSLLSIAFRLFHIFLGFDSLLVDLVDLILSSLKAFLHRLVRLFLYLLGLLLGILQLLLRLFFLSDLSWSRGRWCVVVWLVLGRRGLAIAASISNWLLVLIGCLILVLSVGIWSGLGLLNVIGSFHGVETLLLGSNLGLVGGLFSGQLGLS